MREKCWAVVAVNKEKRIRTINVVSEEMFSEISASLLAANAGLHYLGMFEVNFDEAPGYYELFRDVYEFRQWVSSVISEMLEGKDITFHAAGQQYELIEFLYDTPEMQLWLKNYSRSIGDVIGKIGFTFPADTSPTTP